MTWTLKCLVTLLAYTHLFSDPKFINWHFRFPTITFNPLSDQGWIRCPYFCGFSSTAILKKLVKTIIVSQIDLKDNFVNGHANN